MERKQKGKATGRIQRRKIGGRKCMMVVGGERERSTYRLVVDFIGIELSMDRSWWERMVL